MAKIVLPTEQASELDSNINVRRTATDAAGAAQIGQSTSQLSGIVGNESQQYLQSAQKAEQVNQQAKTVLQQNYMAQASLTGQYASAMLQAVGSFAKALDDQNQQLEKDGGASARQYPRNVAQAGQDISNNVAASIDDPNVKQAFQDNFGAYRNQKQLDAHSKANGAELDYVKEQLARTSYNFSNQAIASGNMNDMNFFYDQHSKILNSAVAAGVIKPEDRFKQEQAFNDTVQHGYWRNAINANPNMALQQLMSRDQPSSDSSIQSQFMGGASSGSDTSLQSLNVGNQASGQPINNFDPLSRLSEPDRTKFISEAQTAVQRQQAQEQAFKQSQDTQFQKLYGQADKILQQGGQISPEIKDTLINAGNGTRFSTPVNQLLQKQDAVRGFSLLPSSQRDAALAQLQATDPNSEAYKFFSTVHTNLSKQEDTDLVGLALSQKVLPGVNALDMNKPLAQQLQQRQPVITYLEQHYQKPTSGLTDNEVNQLKATLSTSNADQRAQIYQSIVQGLGPDANKLFSSLYAKGSSSDAFAGSMAADGQHDVAKDILVGQDLKAKTKDFAMIHDKDIAGSGTTVPYFFPQQHQDTMDAAKNVYASYTANERDYSGVFNQDRWQKAVAAVTNGGAINVGGIFSKNYIEPPVKNMSASDFNKWRSGLSVDDVQKMGGIKGVDPQAASALIKDGTLVQYGKGSYLVQVQQGGQGVYLMDDKSNGTKPFVLSYDTSSLTPDLALQPRPVNGQKANDYANDLMALYPSSKPISNPLLVKGKESPNSSAKPTSTTTATSSIPDESTRPNNSDEKQLQSLFMGQSGNSPLHSDALRQVDDFNSKLASLNSQQGTSGSSAASSGRVHSSPSQASSGNSTYGSSSLGTQILRKLAPSGKDSDMAPVIQSQLINNEQAHGATTLRSQLQVWAPSDPKAQSAFIADVATRLGVGADDVLDLAHNPGQVDKLVQIITAAQHDQAAAKPAQTTTNQATDSFSQNAAAAKDLFAEKSVNAPMSQHSNPHYQEELKSSQIAAPVTHIAEPGPYDYNPKFDTTHTTVPTSQTAASGTTTSNSVLVPANQPNTDVQQQAPIIRKGRGRGRRRRR